VNNTKIDSKKIYIYIYKDIHKIKVSESKQLN